ncbi:WD40-repeat-containing domain protein [Gongronella butleri]|nr:WD40-repeat-containing domain protein [Gongronella butleri]
MSSPTQRCYRHRKDLAKKRHDPPFDLSLERLSSVDGASIQHIWSLFAAAPQNQRQLMLKGILSACCMPQLSFIYESLQPLLKIDFVAVLPRHVSLEIFSYLDAITLCQVAQVSRAWQRMANDETLWHSLCQQHIGRHCLRCGWALACAPWLLEPSRHLAPPTPPPPARLLKKALHGLPLSRMAANEPANGHHRGIAKKRNTRHATNSTRHAKHPSNNHTDHRIRSWKTLYRDGMLVERNWRHHRYKDTLVDLPEHNADDQPPKNDEQPSGDERAPKDGVICMAFCDPIGVYMIGYADRTIHVYKHDSKPLLHHQHNQQQQQDHPLMRVLVMPSELACLQFDENKLIVGHTNHSVSIWDWHRGVNIRTLVGHHAPLTALKFASNVLVTGAIDHTLRVWDFASGHSTLLAGHDGPVRSVDILDRALTSSPTRVIISAGDDASIRVWLDNQCVRVLTGHHAPINKVALVPRDLLHNQHYDDTAVLTALPSPDQENTPKSTNLSRALLPLALSCSQDHTVRLWDLETGQCLRTLFGHVDHITCMASDGLRIATGAKDRSVRIWSVATGECIYSRILEHPVNAIALSWSALLVSINGIAHMWNYAHTGVAHE